MELKDLRYFIAVAEELHFGRAAARLHISPPPLTQRIQNLERELGASLFHRTKRSVRTSAAGEALLGEARRILLEADGLKATAQRAVHGITGSLRAGVIGSAIYSQGRSLQQFVARAMPDVRLVWQELSSIDQIQALRQHRLDLGLVNTPIASEGVTLGRAVREPLAVAVPRQHRLAHRASVALPELRDDVFILGARHLSPGFYDRVISACHARGFSPAIDHQASHMLTYLGLVAIGAGISLVPASFATAGLAGVHFLELDAPAPYAEISLAWNPDHRSPTVARLLELFEGRPGDVLRKSGAGGTASPRTTRRRTQGPGAMR